MRALSHSKIIEERFRRRHGRLRQKGKQSEPMLRFDVALQALRNQLKLSKKAAPAPSGGVLIPFPVTKRVSEKVPAPKRRLTR